MESLINMQLSKEEAKQEVSPSTEDAPKYPWGLEITLNDDSLTKLGVKSLPSVETEVTIIAKAVVSGVTERQSQGGENYRSLDLQITDMQLDDNLLERATEKLYGK